MDKFKLLKTTLKVLKRQSEHDQKCSDAFKVILPDDHVSFYNNTILTNHLEDILKEDFKDDSDWIDYYIYELNFGKKFKKGMITDKGKNIKLKTVKDLYKILTNKR